ncbi:MAG: transporter substrate-binding protein [Paenibacillaceae bacterium]|jgi:putative aldouronate transport system substrate-binding protein|nr:transporter substrate-binding protein [Paenibacillaceae bacterium]
MKETRNKKRNTINRAAQWTAAGIVLAVALTGCGKEDSNSDKAPDQPEASAVAAKPVNVSWHMRKPIDTIKDQEAVEAEANKLLQKAVNATLHINFIDNAAWEDKMKLMSAAGEAYDLVLTASWTNSISNNVARGAFLPLDDLLKEHGQDIMKKVDPRAWQAVTYKNKIMAIPAQSPYSSPVGFVFKKELADKYKLDTSKISKLEDLEPFLEQIKVNEPGITPLLAAKNITAGILMKEHTDVTKNLKYNEKTGKLVWDTDVPEWLDFFRVMNKFYQKGYIAKDAALKTDYTAEAKSGKYAVMRDSGGYTADGSKSTSLYGFPTVESLIGYPIITTGNMTGGATAISKTSADPVAAMKVLNEVWKNPTLSNTLAYGLVDKNYTVQSGAGTDHPKVAAKTGAEQTWAIWHNWLGPLWDQWDSNWNSTAALNEMQKNNNEAKTSALLGFNFDAEPVKSEMAQVSAVYAEMSSILNTGSMPSFDEFIASMKDRLLKAGMDKVQAEAQKQIDAWLAAKK